MGNGIHNGDFGPMVLWLVLSLGPIIYLNLAANGVIPWELF